MNSNQSTSPEIEVLPSSAEFKRAIEVITGDASKPVYEDILREEIVANHHSLSELGCEAKESVQIAEAVEKGLLKRGQKESMLLLGSESKGVSETHIL